MKLVGVVENVEIDEKGNITIAYVGDRKIKLEGQLYFLKGAKLYYDEKDDRYFYEKNKDEIEYKIKVEDLKKREILGSIVGKTETTRFQFHIKPKKESNVYELTFIITEHGKSVYLGQITKITREKNKNIAQVRIVGEIPKTPFYEGSNIYRANENDVKHLLKMSRDELYIGHIYGTDIKVYASHNNLMKHSLFVCGQKGSGKSYFVGVLLEELIKKGMPIVVIDPHGEYVFTEPNNNQDEKQLFSVFEVSPRNYSSSYIQFSFDKKINPLSNAEITIKHLRNDKFYKNFVVKEGQISVFNLRGVERKDQINVVSTLVDRLFELRKIREIPPFFLVIEEAHEMCPQKHGSHPSGDVIKNFSSEGRKFGAGLIVITQRPARISKDVITPMQNFAVMKVGWKNDKDVIQQSVMDADLYMDIIDRLPVGVSYIAGMTTVPLLVKIRVRETRHFGDAIQIDSYLFKNKEKIKIENIQKQIDKLII